ncbi:hypothetical protein BDZ91DRAFT_784154 [Kalaharituber pfeilii]|nr:hypothetical protein BDZ91DRAFT_784154 [Kalaharituber pfeilii]
MVLNLRAHQTLNNVVVDLFVAFSAQFRASLSGAVAARPGLILRLQYPSPSKCEPFSLRGAEGPCPGRPLVPLSLSTSLSHEHSYLSHFSSAQLERPASPGKLARSTNGPKTAKYKKYVTDVLELPNAGAASAQGSSSRCHKCGWTVVGLDDPKMDAGGAGGTGQGGSSGEGESTWNICTDEMDNSIPRMVQRTFMPPRARSSGEGQNQRRVDGDDQPSCVCGQMQIEGYQASDSSHRGLNYKSRFITYLDKLFPDRVLPALNEEHKLHSLFLIILFPFTSPSRRTISTALGGISRWLLARNDLARELVVDKRLDEQGESVLAGRGLRYRLVAMEGEGARETM